MNEDDSIKQLDEAKQALSNAEKQFGADSLEVADSLDSYARLLRTYKQELLTAVNYEAKSKVIRSKNSASTKPDSGATRKCPYCGTSMPKEALLCISCNPGDADSPLLQQVLTPAKPGMRICPFCAGEITAESKICWHCDARLPAYKTNSPGASISASKRVNPILMATLSLLTLNGVGQWKMGQKKKGITMIIVSFVIGALTLGFSVLLTAPVAAIDAYLIGKKLQRGDSVGEWEFF